MNVLANDRKINNVVICFLHIFAVKFTLNDNIKWIKMNNDQNGYYRVMYNQENWDGLIAQLRADHSVFTKKVN